MLALNEKQFEKLNANGSRVLENTYVYVLSRELSVKEDGEEVLVGNENLLSLCPDEKLLKALQAGEISKKSFKKQYLESLKSYENTFLIYTILRAFNEKKCMPVFVCSDEEWETGYLKIFTKYLSKKFGLKLLKPKQYKKDVLAIWKDVKKMAKGKKRKKAFRRNVIDYIKDVAQIGIEGLEKLETLDKKFAIDRIAILINQSDMPMDEIPKKSIIKSIQAYANLNKKSAKMVRSAIKELDLSKKTERWSKKDAIELALNIYEKIHDTGEDKKQ